ncbi:MAG: glycoside hydrolase family 75 protein [Cyanobacteria bacterium SZAS-4]|nr:glycoside hydrolase family 75 protein [Cyanobacteria bacterium SZAS-4]
MSFDRTQQQQQQSPERVAERAISYHASRRMSDEAHQQQHQLSFHPREDRERPFLQHAIHRENETIGDVLRAARHGRPETTHDRQNHRQSNRQSDRHEEREGVRRSERQIDSHQNGLAQRRSGKAHDILHSASEGVGQKLWARTKFAGVVQGGNLGCAASVSECLQRAGFSYANDAGVGGLVDQLKKKGWTQHPISEARAGDVIYGHKGGGWRNGGGNAHIGIMGENGQAFANSSGSGRWKHGPLEGIVGARRFGQNRFCLRPPGANSEFGPPERFDGPPDRFDGPPDRFNGPPQRFGPPDRFIGPPMDGRRPPLDGQCGPFDGRRPPFDNQSSPFDNQRPPLDGQRPPMDGRPPGNGALDVIMDGRTSATDKLAAVQEMSHQGMSNFRFQGQDGQTYSMRTETQSVGSREMVHLFITMPDGKERVVLRGIAQGDGTFTKEQSANGQSVDFYGKGAGTVYGGETFSPSTRNGRADDTSSDSNDAIGPANRYAPSLYDRYRREEEQRQPDQPINPFNGGPNDTSGASLNKIMDDAQRAANNGVNQLIRTPQGVYMRARMDIDADGSPRARQIDPTGQTQTSMRYTDGSSVNAEVVPYMVLPGGQYSQFGIKLGDMCLVRNKENGRMTVAVFADVGPRHKRGEGSMALAEELGINPSPTRGGMTKPNIEYLVLPGSGYPAQNQHQLLDRIKAQKQRLGMS